MNFTFKNIGTITSDKHPVSQIGIGLKGVTLLNGDNASNKSIIARAMFCTLNAYYNVENTVENSKVSRIKTKLRRVNFEEYSDDVTAGKHQKLAKQIYLKADRNNLEEDVQRIIRESFTLSDNHKELDVDYDKIVKRASDDIIKTLEKDLSAVLNPFVVRYFDNEFKGQLSNVDAAIRTTEIGVETFRATHFLIKDSKELVLNKLFSFNTPTFYLDNPFLMDVQYEPEYGSIEELLDTRGIILRHEHLKFFLYKEMTEDMTYSPSSAVQKVIDRIEKIVGGTLITDKKGYLFKSKQNENPIRLINVGSSHKLFFMILALLKNGSLIEGGHLIIDNMDIFLDKKHKKYLNALITMLNKEMGVKIVLVTNETKELAEMLESEQVAYEINKLT